MGTGPRLTHQNLKVLRAFFDNSAGQLTGTDVMKLTGLASGSAYPILLRFEQAGLLDSQWEDADPTKLGRPRRRWYRITGAGEQVAREALEQLAVNLRTPMPEFG